MLSFIQQLQDDTKMLMSKLLDKAGPESTGRRRVKVVKINGKCRDSEGPSKRPVLF